MRGSSGGGDRDRGRRWRGGGRRRRGDRGRRQRPELPLESLQLPGGEGPVGCRPLLLPQLLQRAGDVVEGLPEDGGLLLELAHHAAQLDLRREEPALPQRVRRCRRAPARRRPARQPHDREQRETEGHRERDARGPTRETPERGQHPGSLSVPRPSGPGTAVSGVGPPASALAWSAAAPAARPRRGPRGVPGTRGGRSPLASVAAPRPADAPRDIHGSAAAPVAKSSGTSAVACSIRAADRIIRRIGRRPAGRGPACPARAADRSPGVPTGSGRSRASVRPRACSACDPRRGTGCGTSSAGCRAG
jgi:hypothetical protein